MLAFCLFVSWANHQLFVTALLPPLPHCDQSYSATKINYILQNLNDASMYHLGDAASTDACKAKCLSLNYLCGASASNPNVVVYNNISADPNTLSLNQSSCELRVNSLPKNGWGPIALTPVFQDATDEYIIELNVTILEGEEAGIAIGSSSDAFDRYYFAGLQPSAAQLVCGEFMHDQFDVSLPFSLDESTASASLSYDTMYTLRVHLLPDGTWTVHLDGELKFTSSLSQMVSPPLSQVHVGIEVVRAHFIAHSFKVTFPSSIDEALCAAYMYNKDTLECHAYYGSGYSALYSSLTASTSYDSGIIEYAACPTTSPPTAQPTETSELSSTTASETDDHVNRNELDAKAQPSVFALAMIVCGSVLCCVCTIFLFCVCYRLQKTNGRRKPSSTAVIRIQSASASQPVSSRSDIVARSWMIDNYDGARYDQPAQTRDGVDAQVYHAQTAANDLQNRDKMHREQEGVGYDEGDFIEGDELELAATRSKDNNHQRTKRDGEESRNIKICDDEFIIQGDDEMNATGQGPRND